MEFKDIIRYQYQKIILIALLIVVGFGFYKVYSAFFKRVDMIWQARFQYDYAMVLAKARHDLESARFDLDHACFFSNHSEECQKAKEAYQKAKENYDKVMASKDELFRTEKQVKSYYDAILLSARQTPLPFLLLVLSLASLVIIAYFLFREFLPRRGKWDL